MSSFIDMFMLLCFNSVVCWFLEGSEEAYRATQWTVMKWLHVFV